MMNYAKLSILGRSEGRCVLTCFVQQLFKVTRWQSPPYPLATASKTSIPHQHPRWRGILMNTTYVWQAPASPLQTPRFYSQATAQSGSIIIVNDTRLDIPSMSG